MSNLRARAGLKTTGLRKPGLQNRRAGRPGPVPIPRSDGLILRLIMIMSHLYNVDNPIPRKNPESRGLKSRDFKKSRIPGFSGFSRDFSRDFQDQFPILGFLRTSHSGFYRGFHMLISSPGVLKFSGFFTRIFSRLSNPGPNLQDFGFLEFFDLSQTKKSRCRIPGVGIRDPEKIPFRSQLSVKD